MTTEWPASTRPCLASLATANNRRPAFDTLFLTGPISYDGLVQCAGRVIRAAPGKDTAEVHDYHDPATPILAASLQRRMPGYPLTFELGLDTVEVAPGEWARIYSPGRTVVDLMRIRHKLGESVAHVTLRS